MNKSYENDPHTAHFYDLRLFTAEIKAQSLSTVEPYIAPTHWLDTFTHEDSSRSQVLVFKSIAGVSYAVQSSHDLVEWTDVTKYYGLGQEISVPMIQIAAPPIQNEPPSPSPVPLVLPKYVSMIVRVASTGGIVVSWHSLDHARPIEHHLSELSLSSSWQQYIFYMRRFDGYYFSVAHPSTITVPKANSALGVSDAAMIATFTSRFAEINQEVVDSVQRSRMNPPEPAPFDPNSRKFFRVVADWTLDSDSDLSPDWLEFMAMYGQNGMQPVSSAMDENGNPFLITANPFGDAFLSNGLPMGKIADYDKDGCVDVDDVNPAEPLLNWERSAFRYAMFPVAVPDTEEPHDSRALQTNALGQVLFRHSIWRNAQHTSLNDEGMLWCHALAMNDLGVILGNSYSEVEGMMGLNLWDSAADEPYLIKCLSQQGNEIFAQMTEAHFYGSFLGEDMFTDTRSFCASGAKRGLLSNVPAQALEPTPGLSQWNRNAAGQYGYTEIEARNHFVKDPTHRWKFPDENGVTVVDGQPVSALVSKFVMMPGGTCIACTHDHPRSKSHFKYGSQAWKTLRNLESLKDFAPTGIGITAEREVWLNNSLMQLKRVAPASGVSADIWGGYDLMDLSPLGHLLVAKDEADDSSEIANGHSAVALGYPFSLKDNAAATGVDNISQTTVPSYIPSNGFQEKLWVMAPQGTWLGSNGQSQNNSNWFTIKAPLSGLTAEFSLDNATSKAYTLFGDDTNVEFSGTGSSTTDGNVTFRMNGNTSQSFPIGVKSMKRRTVNVHLVRCQHAVTATAGEDDAYDFDIPTATVYLNKVFGAQINVYFSITASTLIAGQQGYPVPLYPTMPQDDQNYISTDTIDDLIDTLPFPQNTDIRVYAVGHVISTGRLTASGIAPTGKNTVFVEPMRHYENLPEKRNEYALRILAHEIGHVICGEGHPDEKGGAAVLPGTDHSKRLMCSGNVAHDSTALLVKREWDMAEEWLRARPDQRMIETLGYLPDSY